MDIATSPPPLFDKVPGQIANGHYTMTGPRGHRTIKVSTILAEESPLRGRRKVSVFTGSDNLFAYTGVAFLNTDKDGKDGIKVWKRFEGTQLHKVVLAWLQTMLKDDPAYPELAIKWKAYSIVAARDCLLCNRLLTNPDSIARGIGPVCGKDEAPLENPNGA